MSIGKMTNAFYPQKMKYLFSNTTTKKLKVAYTLLPSVEFRS